MAENTVDRSAVGFHGFFTGGAFHDHWGVGNLLSLMQQIGGWIPAAEE
jgi:hypothetical protein